MFDAIMKILGADMTLDIIMPGVVMKEVLAGGAHSAFGDWRDGAIGVFGSAAFWTVCGVAVVWALLLVRRMFRAFVQRTG